jgi:AcrR family transcriptional regulator
MSPENKPRSSADRRRRARRVDAERNEAALLAAARTLFEQRGPGVALDEIARTAGVANATLYRHFPTRSELIVAVYSSEVSELDGLAERLLHADDPDLALAEWLRAFVRHVADKRDLALALPDEPAGRRGALFANWHETMQAAAGKLLSRAQSAGTARAEIGPRDLLTLATGIALTGVSDERTERLLAIARHGYAN